MRGMIEALSPCQGALDPILLLAFCPVNMGGHSIVLEGGRKWRRIGIIIILYYEIFMKAPLLKSSLTGAFSHSVRYICVFIIY